MIRITDQYFWNFVFGLFFVGLVAMSSIILETEARKSFSELTVLELVILTLATYRFTRLFVNDIITKFFREQFWDTKESRGQVHLVKPPGGPRRTLADLMACPWCFGIWAAATVLFFYLFTPYADLPVYILALGGAATWIHQLAALIGWKAQQIKEQVER